jgi:hypothetical protein
MDQDTTESSISALGCRKEGFPQTYLGLPLSNTKLLLNLSHADLQGRQISSGVAIKPVESDGTCNSSELGSG